MNVLALVILSLFQLPPAHADASAWDTLEFLRNGARPTATAADTDRVKDLFVTSLGQLKNEIKRQARPSSVNCGEFAKTTLRTIDDLRKSLKKFNGAELDSADAHSVYARTRLLLTIPSFKTLHQLFVNQREGGFGVLTGLPDEACVYADRAALEQQFSRTNQDATDFRTAALGDPGLLGLDRITARLLIFADAQQVSYDRWSWAFIGGTLVATAVLWQFATPLISAQFGVGTTASRLVFVGTAVTENIAYFAIDLTANPEPEQRSATRVLTYGEIMRDVTALVSSDFDQPQLYIAYLSAIQAHTSALVGNWVQANIAHLDPAGARR